MREYTPPPKWSSPAKAQPSGEYSGEHSTAPIHEAVGRALTQWEFLDSALIKLFQLLCETRSLAACRAYGTIESVFGRYLALRYAAEEFFASRDEPDLQLTLTLLKTYNDTGQYRNQIAHGVAIQPHAHGYFLSAPSYATRRRTTPYPDQKWGLGSSYFYRVAEIDKFSSRFEQLVGATMSLVTYLNEKYTVLPPGDLHP